jgi:hypothetical protein
VSFVAPAGAPAPGPGGVYLLLLEPETGEARYRPAGSSSWLELSPDGTLVSSPASSLEALAGRTLESATTEIDTLTGRMKDRLVTASGGPCKPVPTTCNLAPCINPGFWEIGFEGTALDGLPITITNLTTGQVTTKVGADPLAVPSWKLISAQGTCSTYKPLFFVDNSTLTDCHVPTASNAILTFDTVTYRIQFGSLGAVLFRGNSADQCAGGGLDAVYRVTSAGVTWRWGSDHHAIWGWPTGGCTSAADCSDGLVCTDDVCTNGTCSHPAVTCPNPEPYCYDAVCQEITDGCTLVPSVNYNVPFPCGNNLMCYCE